ncbi:MAG TPA: hypothetical protein VFY14_09310 [Streptomyces sp.]|nr:hypothetical protein [Streptomyces sp.]
MTGPEFAAAHGNDSSTWTPADFDTEINLAEIDAHTTPQPTDDQQPARSPHRVRRTTLCTGFPPDHMNFGLTEGRSQIRTTRRTASVFHTYTTTTRDGSAVHVAYALYPKGSRNRVPFEVLELWEVPAAAVLDSFGLLPTTATTPAA